jgi:hypothetical protein
MFLGAHFVWAFSLMFLFSGRGYWQELIESIVWAHNKLKVAPAIQPRALSITQGRAVGVAHYLLGGIATTWAFFLARIIRWDRPLGARFQGLPENVPGGSVFSQREPLSGYGIPRKGGHLVAPTNPNYRIATNCVF